MERRTFIRGCGMACMGGGSLMALFLEGCTVGNKAVTGTIEQSDLKVPVSAFVSGNGHFRKYVVVQEEHMKYPVCVYRFSEREYTALLMRCTHQGTELEVFGERLECPAHGSEFNNRGEVKTGPADTNLRTFPVSIDKDQLLISLK